MQRVTTAASVFGRHSAGRPGLADVNALTGDGYYLSYSGESAGGSGQFSPEFFNGGTRTWVASVLGLFFCAADKVTCNLASPNAYASAWFPSTVYANPSEAAQGYFQNNTTPQLTAPLVEFASVAVL